MDGQLYHHGIKGQKWGVIRTPEQLGHETEKEQKVRATAAAIYMQKAAKDSSYYSTASSMRDKLISGLSDETIQAGKDYAYSLLTKANRRFVPSKKAKSELNNIVDMANFSLEHPVGSENRDTAVQYYNKSRKQAKRAEKLHNKEQYYLSRGDTESAYRVQRKAARAERRSERNRLKANR